jgi:hypothetical protein
VQTVVGELLMQPLEAKVPSALAGDVNVTSALVMGLPSASVTVARSGLAKDVLTSAAWAAPEVAAILLAEPGLTVKPRLVPESPEEVAVRLVDSAAAGVMLGAFAPVATPLAKVTREVPVLQVLPEPFEG